MLKVVLESVEALDIGDTFKYESISIEAGYRPIGFRFFQSIVNIKAKLRGRELIVAGEASTHELAFAKARSELIERSVLISAPESYRTETSNGWAAHPSFEYAKLNAIFELLERDAVLSQWYGSTPFLQVPKSELPKDLQRWLSEELAQSEYPELDVLISTNGIGPSVSCILKNKDGFAVSGHATRATLSESIDSALAEACRAAHATLRREYWSDTLKLKRQEPGLVNPGAHSVYYAYHEPLPNWMVGRAIGWNQAETLWLRRIAEVSANIDDFNFKTVLDSPLFVGFAKHPFAFDVRWGTTSENEVLSSSGAKRMRLGSINTKTHIVA